MICHLTYLKFELTYEKSLLISGGSDGLLVLWTAENSESREISPKQTIKVFFYDERKFFLFCLSYPMNISILFDFGD